MSTQDFLSPIASHIVGSAIQSVKRKKKLGPSLSSRKGLRVRGPRSISAFTKPNRFGKLHYIYDKELKGYFVKFNEDLVGFVRDEQDINKLALPGKLKGKAARSLLNRIVYGVKGAGRVITKPQRQIARRSGLIGAMLAGGGAGTTGAVLGHRRGKKKGHEEGYIRAINDVLATEKITHPKMIKLMENLQAKGVTLEKLKKGNISAAPVEGLSLVREDLHGGRSRKRRKKKFKKIEITNDSKLEKGLVSAVGRNIVGTARSYAPKLRGVFRQAAGKVKSKVTEPAIRMARRNKFNLGMTGAFLGTEALTRPKKKYQEYEGGRRKGEKSDAHSLNPHPEDSDDGW